MRVFICDKETLNFTSNVLDQNNPMSKYQCKNKLIYIRDFEAVQKARRHVFRFKNSCLRLEFLNLIIHSYSLFKQYKKVMCYIGPVWCYQLSCFSFMHTDMSLYLFSRWRGLQYTVKGKFLLNKFALCYISKSHMLKLNYHFVCFPFVLGAII